MDNISFISVLVLKFVGLAGCLFLAFWQIKHGFLMFKTGKSTNEKGKLKFFGMTFTVESSGALVMCLATAWVWGAIQFNPEVQASSDGFKFANALLKVVPRAISAPSSVDVATADNETLIKLFRAATEQNPQDSIASVSVAGKPVTYTVTAINAGPGTDNLLSVSLSIPAANTTRKLTYVPLNRNNTVSFLPLNDASVVNGIDKQEEK